MPRSNKTSAATAAAAWHEPAHAKINLTLHVTGKRADGYHVLDSLVLFTEFGDHLSARPARQITLEISGPFADKLSTTDNLVISAAKALEQALGEGRGAALHLEKNLPPASGMGGGSADAAATLRLLQKLWSKTLPGDGVQTLALKLGADVPVCLAQAPAFMRGIGEDLDPVTLFPTLPVVLINPGVHVATPDVFRALNYNPANARCLAPKPPVFTSAEDLLDWLSHTRNDLIAPAIRLSPEIGHVLELLDATKDCRLARMSGSGATCFGLFSNEKSAKAAARTVQKLNPDWWVQATKIPRTVIPV
jgi:4-diphosphocytidyl-2-C-methyl-D-erythritol kinase